MEKYEKINQKKRHNMKVIMGSVFTTGCVVLLWGLSGMNDSSEGAEGGERPKNKLMRAFHKMEKTVGRQAERLGHHQQHSHQHHPDAKERAHYNEYPDEEEDGGKPHKHTPHHLKKKHERHGEDKGYHLHEHLARMEHKEKELDDIHDESEEKALVARVQTLDQEVRDIKKNLAPGHFMETDEKGVAASKRLQDATRLLLHARFGPAEPYRVRVDLLFQESNPTYATDGPTGSFVIEMAPSSLQPHSIMTFLEVARLWEHKKGAFHRRANHVLQVMVNGGLTPHLAFQEYSEEYPHKKGTVGYAGRPSGPAWYVSIQNNVGNHGPGSQQKANPHEADSCFGTVVEGFDDVVLKRITKMPGDGFLKSPAHVLIDSMTILIPDPETEGVWTEWKPSHAVTEFDQVKAKLKL